nr:MAG TPA: hypothetical protein [Caudoviricetes sp.]
MLKFRVIFYLKNPGISCKIQDFRKIFALL